MSTTQYKAIPFKQESKNVVKMPNGQTVSKEEVKILIGMLNLERKGITNKNGEAAEAIAKRLLKSKAKIETLTDKLKEIIG